MSSHLKFIILSVSNRHYNIANNGNLQLTKCSNL